MSGYNTVASNASGFAAFNAFENDILITSFQPGCSWGIGTLIMAPAWRNNVVVTFTGTRANQADCVVRTTLLNPFVVSFVDLSVCGLLRSLRIRSEGGSQTPRVSGLGAHVAFSNVQIFTEASAKNDPHLIGASGMEFDFDGKPGGVYNLFSAPQFQVTMLLAGDGPGTHFMTQIGLLFKGETFLFGESTMTEAFRADLEDRLSCVGGSLLEWSSFHAKVALCPGHSVSITQMHTGEPWLMHADGSPYNYYDVAVVARGCHDAYDGALGQTYNCRYADEKEVFAWSHGQEEVFRLPTLFTPSSSYSVEATCDATPAGGSLSGTSARHRQRRGLASREKKPFEAHHESGILARETVDALASRPIGRYRKRAGRRFV